MRRLSADGLDPTLMRRERTDSTGEVIPATVEKPLREAELLFEEQLESMQDAPAGPFGSLRRRSRRPSAAATEYDTCDDYDDDDAYDEDYEDDDDDDDGRAAPEERDRVKSDRHTRRRGGHHEQLGHNKRRSWEDVDALWCPVTHPWGEARSEVKVFEKPDAATKQRLRARVAASPALAALEAAPRTALRRWRLLKNTVLAVGALNDIVRQSREIHSNPVNRGSLRSHLKSWGVAADTQKQLVVPWFVFQPDDPTRVAWDTASALVMLTMIFYIPYNVSFVGPTYVYYVFDWFLTVFFTVDICLSFVTAYEHKGRTVTDPYRSDEAARLRAALRRRALALDAAPAAAPPPPPPDDDDDARLAAEAAYLYEERLVAGAVHDARFLSPSSRRALASELLSLVASAASPTPAGKSRRRSSLRASSQDAAKDEG